MSWINGDVALGFGGSAQPTRTAEVCQKHRRISRLSVVTMEILILILIVVTPLLIYNVRAVRRVNRSSESAFVKTILNMGIWIVPFMGAWRANCEIDSRALAEMPNDRKPEPPLAGIVTESAPDVLQTESALPFSLAAHLEVVNGMPYMDWVALSAWAGSIANETLRSQALVKGKRAWLLHMRDALGLHYRLYESDNAYVLSSLENPVLVATARHIALVRRRILLVLDGVARFKETEKTILIVLDNEDAYYRYVAHYYPGDGEFSGSAGMFITAGCDHVAVWRKDLNQIEPVIAHELTHGAVHYLDLPTWLDEGLAVNTELRLSGSPLILEQEGRAAHLSFWEDAAIQAFWSGIAFHMAGGTSALAYDLARILVGQLARDWDGFKRFVLNARRDDGGAQSARDHLGIDIGAYVCALLERPETTQWSPDPSTWDSLTLVHQE